MAANRTFGRILKTDPRDGKFALKAARTARISRTWDSRWLSADQKATPHCVGFAWSHWLACAPLRQFVDPHGIYAGCKLIDGIPNEDGTYVRAGAKILKAAGFIKEYRWCSTLKPLVTTVLERGPVVVGTDWYSGMEAGGLVTLDGDVLGGHAWLIVGANRKTRRFKAKNSWGVGWSDDGYFEISFDDMETLLRDGGECCLPIEAKPEAAWLK